MQPRFSTIAGATVDVRATPFESFCALDPCLRTYKGTSVPDRLNESVWQAYGSDAFFLPIGKLDVGGGGIEDYPTPISSRIHDVLAYLGIDFENNALGMVSTGLMCATLHAVRTWPGYYLLVRSMLSGMSPGVELFVFKLVK